METLIIPYFRFPIGFSQITTSAAAPVHCLVVSGGQWSSMAQLLSLLRVSEGQSQGAGQLGSHVEALGRDVLQTHSGVGRIQFLCLKHLSSQPLEAACGLHALQSPGQNVEFPRTLNHWINFVLTARGKAVLKNRA